MALDSIEVNHQLSVGHGFPIHLFGSGPLKTRGAAYVQGPMLIGAPSSFPIIEAAVMIGPLNSLDQLYPPFSPPLSVFFKQIFPAIVDPIPPFYPNPLTGEPIPIGDPRYVPGILPAVMIPFPAFGLAWYPAVNYALVVKGGAKIVEDLQVTGNLYVTLEIFTLFGILSFGPIGSIFSIWQAGPFGLHVLSAKKNFDISHPSRDGWRLRHTCLEGPSNDVYIRGKLTNSNVINLPEYWEKFVNPSTITVSITPVGCHQDIMVRRIGDNKVVLQSKSAVPINCFYHIFGERTDGERLIPEYPGLSPADYPGDNSEYNINM